jgi:NADH-quinone oxidoreductase subunit K
MADIEPRLFLSVAVILFTIGMAGFLVRRNILVVFLAVELMLNAGALALLTFARHWGEAGGVNGQVFFFLVLALAAAESAVGLSLVIALYRLKHRLDADDLAELKG